MTRYRYIEIDRDIFGKMERYGALPVVAERQNREQVLVAKFSASSMGVHLVIHVGGFGQWDHRERGCKVYDELHFEQLADNEWEGSWVFPACIKCKGSHFCSAVHQQWKPTPVTGGAFSLQQVKVLTPLPAGKPDLILLTEEDAT